MFYCHVMSIFGLLVWGFPWGFFLGRKCIYQAQLQPRHQLRMAEHNTETINKLKELVTCSICLDGCTEPKQLQCSHACCQQCLVRLVIRNQRGQLTLTCPSCRHVTPVPASGVAGLQAAFLINQLQEIVKSAPASTSAQENATVRCPAHNGTDVELYCETCGQTICHKCIAVLLKMSRNENMSSLTCELMSKLKNTKEKGSIKRGGQNRYEISHQPTTKGRHQLHTKAEGQHIRRSVFSGTQIRTIVGVNGPGRVAINRRGQVVVSETDRHCFTLFSPNGERLRSFGSHGPHKGQFNQPQGVAVDGEECILLADTLNHRVQKFTADGKFVASVGTYGSGPMQFSSPQSIAYNASKGTIYVADKTCRIQILKSADLSYVGSFGKKGSSTGQFHLACDSNGNVFVAGLDEHRILIFSPDGKYLRRFGEKGKKKMVKNQLYGMAIDSDDRICVGEFTTNNTISVFGSGGQFLTSFSGKGRGSGQFDPTGLAVDTNGVVYVCYNSKSRVQIF